MACGMSVPQQGIKPMPPTLGAQSLNHEIAREVPVLPLLESDVNGFTWYVLLCLKFVVVVVQHNVHIAVYIIILFFFNAMWYSIFKIYHHLLILLLKDL